MWLHNTATLELRRFNTPEEVPGGYAILSHVWDAAGEQDFQEFQAIWAEHKFNKKKVHSDVADGALVPVRVELQPHVCLLKPQADAESSLRFSPPSYEQPVERSRGYAPFGSLAF